MQKFLKRFFACMLVLTLLFSNVDVCGAVSTGRASSFYQTEKRQNDTTAKKVADSQSLQEEQEIEASEEEESSEGKEETKDSPQEVTTQDDEKEDLGPESATEESTAKEEEISEGSGESDTEESEETSTQAEKETTSASRKRAVQNIEENVPVLKSVDPRSNHNVDMPDITSHYFLLQKNSKKVSAASGPNLKVVSGEKEASKYVYESYPEGKQYNFTPRMTSKSKVSVGGGNGGGVSLQTVKNGSSGRFGGLVSAAKSGKLQTKAFNLNQCKSNPYAIYTNVGVWHDYKTGKNYAIDMKMTVTGYLFPDASTRKQLSNQEMDAPYAAFWKNSIGIMVMGTDYVQTRLDFYYAGTSQSVSGLKGMVQFCDIDAQQGVDFGKGFEKILMFRTSASKLQYTKSGLIGNSVGYISSRVITDYNLNNASTTALGIFSGSSVNCRWTLAKCDQKDTGGSAKYKVKSGYQIPAESSIEDSRCYYWSYSTGFLGIRADVGLAPLTEKTEKNIYSGSIDSKKSAEQRKYLLLDDRDSVFSYVLSAAADLPTNISKARYTQFQFADTVDSLLNVRKIRIYAAEASGSGGSETYTDVTSSFTITKKENSAHATEVKAAAKAALLKTEAFYGRTYFVHIEAAVKTDAELEKAGKSITDCYQKDNTGIKRVPSAGDLQGSIAVFNQGSLAVSNNQGSSHTKTTEETAAKIPMKIRVKKVDGKTQTPLKGVVFGIFGGEDVEDPSKTKPLYQAVTDENGEALFIAKDNGTFYKKDYGDGPYCIKEISVPDAYKNVWHKTYGKKWVCKIPSLNNKEWFQSNQKIGTSSMLLLQNKNYEAPENSIKIYKKSQDTGAFLSGAEFRLYEWSVSSNSYKMLYSLTETTDETGRIVYGNAKPVTNTMDNLGRYKVTEEKAPKGCVLTGQEWEFILSEEAVNDGIVYENTASGEKQTGILLYENSLQKAKLLISKKNDLGEPVSGAVFTVRAQEDIYAPWDQKEDGSILKGAVPLVAKGETVDEITVGKDGKGETTKGKELYIGKYEVEETRGAAGHIKGDQHYPVDLSYGTDNSLAYIFYTLDVSNQKMKPSFAVSKLADRTTDSQGGEVDFDKAKGRYTEEKEAGIYQAGEETDYKICVTNTGNVPLYHIELTDDMDQKNAYGQVLSEYVDGKTASFVIPDSGEIRTQKGDLVSAHLSEKSALSLVIHHLKVGDSVEVHLKIHLKEEAKDAWKLKNIVYGKAEYDNHDGDSGAQDLTEVPTSHLVDEKGESLVSDQDAINIPGTPGEDVVKTADKTTGIQIKNGEITSGEKIPGTYQAGEKVHFSILVKNTKEAALKKISVKDVMSEELKKMVEEESAGFCLPESKQGESWLTTAQGRKVSAKLVSPTEVLLCSTGEDGEGTDRLFSQDYVTLEFCVTILPGIANFYDLKNQVMVNSWYFDGREEKPVPKAEDQDEIEIPGVPEGKVAKLADRTTGADLKDGRYDASAKISGLYENGSRVNYKITVTNSGSANLYDLTLQDTLSEELEQALEKESVSFVEKTYTSSQGRKVRTKLEEKECLLMDFLAAGDSVDVELHARVKEDVGNLFALKNTVKLSARYQTGNEKEKTVQKETEKQEETDKQEETEKQEETDKETFTSAQETKKAIEEAYQEIQKLTLEEALKESRKYTSVPETKEMSDEDQINIPGTPYIKVAKIADKTTGATLVKGRYEGTKTEGIYEYKDAIDYTITITNSGTSDVHDLVVEDTMEPELLTSLQKESISFADGIFLTEKGDEIQAKESASEKEGCYKLHLDHLIAGDSVELHLTGLIRSGIKQNSGLNNVVKITASYETIDSNGKKEETYVPDTPEMEDNDKIGIGVPKLAIAKTADKTSGILLEDGRYSGERKYGTYHAGETVHFIIHVTNKGNAQAKNLVVREQPTTSMEQYLEIKGFPYQTGAQLTTASGKKVRVQSDGKKQLKIDALAPGDSFKLIFNAKVKKEIVTVKALKNEVTVEGQNKDRTPITKTAEMKDFDKLHLQKKKSTVKTAVPGQSTASPKTGDSHPIGIFLLLAVSSLTVVCILLVNQKRKKNRK